MRSLYYQLIVLVVCNLIAITVSSAVIYLFIILGVFEGPLIYGVLVKAVVFHPCIPGSSPPVIFMIYFPFCWRIYYTFSFYHMCRDENEFISSYAFLITIANLTSLWLMVDLFIALFPVLSWVMLLSFDCKKNEYGHWWLYTRSNRIYVFIDSS